MRTSDPKLIEADPSTDDESDPRDTYEPITTSQPPLECCCPDFCWVDHENS